MRIDKDRFPALFDNDLVIRKFRSWIPKDFVSIFYDMLSCAKKNLYYTASTIMDHISNSYEKLLPLRDQLPDVCRGLLFMMPGNRPHCLFYVMTNHSDRMMLVGQVSAMEGPVHLGDMFAGHFPKGIQELEFHSYEYVKSIDSVTQEVVKIILATELFINYAEIEKKEIQPSRQIWDGPTCLYNNKTRFPITVVDSAWYTHLVSSGAFKVRGHFRLQACGEALKDRKLIWIQDFEKEGYTRKAKIES